MSDSNPREFVWYQPDLTFVPEPARTLLEKYSGIPAEKVLEHVKELRDRAFAVFPYPCIGGFRFLDLDLPASSHYAEILERVKSGEKFLDLGCAMGQELRQLAFDGAPSTNLYASDLRAPFFNLGYDLFLDHPPKLQAQFFEADIFDDDSALVAQLSGKVDIVNAASFFHLFDWDDQVKVAKRVIGLLRPKAGSLLIGRQAGDVNPGKRTTLDYGEKKMEITNYRHDEETWRKLWEQVSRETGTRWDVSVWKEEWGGEDGMMKKMQSEGVFKQRFAVRRL